MLRLTESPSLKVCVSGAVMLTALLTFQLNVVWVALVPSSTITVTLYGPLSAAPAPRVPLMVPVLGLIDRPGARPSAAYFKVAPLSEAVIDSDTVSPSFLVWSSGGVRLIGLKKKERQSSFRVV